MPEEILIDWETWDRDAGLVMGYLRELVSGATWAAMVAALLAYTTTSFGSGWAGCNRKQIENLINEEVGVSWWPLKAGTGPAAFSNIVPTTTRFVGGEVYRFLSDGRVLGAFKSNGSTGYPRRFFTVSGTTLS